ncbi:MAG: hypothetical protein RB191_08145 [Terriglobia bacterium]|nr:hypothetical protein [Terriglobia bacterium]
MNIIVFALAAILVLGGGLATIRFLWKLLSWEMRWEWRMIKLAIHAAMFGAGATIVGLLLMGKLKL